MPVSEEELVRTEAVDLPVARDDMPPVTPRRWPALVLVALGGVLAGMVLTLGLVFASGPRAVPGTPGDPSAAWDSTIILNDAYLTAQARTAGNAQIQEPRMHAGADGKVVLDGRAGLFPLHVILQPTIVDGELRLAVVSAQAGGLPLPAPLASQIESSIASAVQLPPAKVATTLVRVEAKEGQLVLYSRVK